MIKCILENGHKTSFRHITVGALVLNEKKEILLIKRAAQLLRGGLYSIPGGFLDREENLEQGALRELKEETGYVGEVEALFLINDNPMRPKEDRQNVDFIFSVKISGGQKIINEEVTEIKWFAKEDLPREEFFAFDHRMIILRYFKYLEKSFTLPIVGMA